MKNIKNQKTSTNKELDEELLQLYNYCLQCPYFNHFNLNCNAFINSIPCPIELNLNLKGGATNGI